MGEFMRRRGGNSAGVGSRWARGRRGAWGASSWVMRRGAGYCLSGVGDSTEASGAEGPLSPVMILSRLARSVPSPVPDGAISTARVWRYS